MKNTEVFALILVLVFILPLYFLIVESDKQTEKLDIILDRLPGPDILTYTPDDLYSDMYVSTGLAMATLGVESMVIPPELDIDPSHPTDTEWYAICFIESTNGINTNGDDGRAIGPAQIHKICVEDVNRILGEMRYTYEDRSDNEMSREMFNIYTDYYVGSVSPLEDRLRIWNGGPKGLGMTETLGYAKRVMEML